ncbi:hypothetical protein SCLCIDRAFT_1222198 [Scleroderma citrinum Foug A]|uniref:Uncharacterized protein n=1 Tax=Scleroderma citrinum Foug A TaxID=1036808 RepID=A0A0C2YXB0_9AGAM|nr:hypothetical protein SCLCIDRAFT_1222198 [Scleroderma citrinum Foug A]
MPMLTTSPANRYSKSGDEVLSCSMKGYEGLNRGVWRFIADKCRMVGVGSCGKPGIGTQDRDRRTHKWPIQRREKR